MREGNYFCLDANSIDKNMIKHYDRKDSSEMAAIEHPAVDG